MLATLNPRQPYLPFFFDLNSPRIPRDRTPIRFSAGSNRAKIAAFWSRHSAIFQRREVTSHDLHMS
jgi:hypothetical protein